MANLAHEVHESSADPSDAVVKYLGMALAQLEDFHTTYFKQEAEKTSVRAGGETQINLPTNQVINWPSIALHFNAKSWIPGRAQRYADQWGTSDAVGNATAPDPPLDNPQDVVSNYQDFVARLPEDGESLIQDLEVKSGGMDWVNVNDYYLIVKLCEMYLDKSQLDKKKIEQGTTIHATDATFDPLDRLGRPLTFRQAYGYSSANNDMTTAFVFDDANFDGSLAPDRKGLMPNLSDGSDRPFETQMDPTFTGTQYPSTPNGGPVTIYRPNPQSGGLWQGSEWYPRPGHSVNYKLGADGTSPARMQVFSQGDVGTVFNISSLKTIFNQMYPAVMDLSTVNNITVRIRFRPPTAIPVSRVRDSYDVTTSSSDPSVTSYYFHTSTLFNDINGGTDPSERVKYSEFQSNGTDLDVYKRVTDAAEKDKRRETPPTGNFEVTDIAMTYESISMNSPLYARQVEQLANNGTLEFQFKSYYNYSTLHRGSSQTGFNTQCLDSIYAAMQDPSADAPAPPVQMYNGRVIPRSHRFHHFGIEGWQFEINQASLPKNFATPAEASHYFFDGAADKTGYLDSLRDFTDYKYFCKVRLNFPYASCRLLSGLDIRGVNAVIRFVTRLNGGMMREVADPKDGPINEPFRLYQAGATVGLEDQRNRRGQFYARLDENLEPTEDNVTPDKNGVQLAASQLIPPTQRTMKQLRDHEHVFPEVYPNGVLLHLIFEFTSTLRIGAGRQAEIIQ